MVGARMVRYSFSCMTLAFTTSRRFIPTLSRLTICPTLSAYLCALARGVLVTNATLAAPGGITSILVAAGKWSTDLYQ